MKELIELEVEVTEPVRVELLEQNKNPLPPPVLNFTVSELTMSGRKVPAAGLIAPVRFEVTSEVLGV